NLPTTAIVESGPYRFTQPHLPLPVPGSDRLGHCVRQSLAADHAGALRPRHPLRRSGPRGSLSRAQVWRCLPWLPLACTALAVGLAGPRPALALFLEQPRELRLARGQDLGGQLLSSNWVMRVRRQAELLPDSGVKLPCLSARN